MIKDFNINMGSILNSYEVVDVF